MAGMSSRPDKGTLKVCCPPFHGTELYSVAARGTELDDAKSSTNRWSDIIPPEAALTFAVVWDTEDDIALFSGAELLEQQTYFDDLESPCSAYEYEDSTRSDTTAIPSRRHSLSTLTSRQLYMNHDHDNSTAILSYFHERHEMFFHGETPDKVRPCKTQASSTFDGLDVYARGSLLFEAHPAKLRYPCLDMLDSNFYLNPCLSFNKLDDTATVTDGVNEDSQDSHHQPRARFLRSFKKRISSAFADARVSMLSAHLPPNDCINAKVSGDDCTSCWCAVERPNTPTHSRLLSLSPQQTIPKRLRKRRPDSDTDIPASPVEVLKRNHFGHDIPPPPEPPVSPPTSFSFIPKFVRTFTRLARPSGYDAWVCIEIHNEIHLHNL